MTDKKDEPPKGAAVDPKRPHAVIDLKATEVVINSGAKSNAAEGKAAAQVVADAAKTAAAVQAKGAEAKPGDAKSGESVKASGTTGTTTGPRPPTDRMEPAVAAAAAATAPTPRPGGFGSHLVAGIVGGALSLLGAQQLAPMLGLGGTSAALPPEVANRLAALERSSTARPATGDTAQKLTAAEARLAKLEEAAQALAEGQVKVAGETKALEGKLAAAGAGDDATARLAKIEEQFNALTAAATADPRNAGRLPQLALLTSRIGELETQLTTRTAALRSEVTQELDRRFARSGEQTESARSRLASRTQSVEQTLKSVADETTALRSGFDGLKSDVETRFRQVAKPADVQAALAPLSTKLGTLEQNLQGVVKSERERNATAGNILLSLELGNLKRALERGGKFTSELAAVKSLAGTKLDLATLEAQAATGVPSATTLAGELRGLAHTMLDAEQEPQNASVTDRMLSGFKSIVRVRKTTAGPDEQGTEAIIARMETALKEGRLADVIDEAKKLSPAAAQPAEGWIKRIGTRVTVDKALADLEASLKTSLAGGAAPKKGSN